MTRSLRHLSMRLTPISLALVLVACSGGGGEDDGGAEGMGPGPGAKEASFEQGALVDYTKQPYTPNEYASAAKIEDGDGNCSYHETSKKDYSGQKITVLAPPPPNMGEPMAQHAAMFRSSPVARSRSRTSRWGSSTLRLRQPSRPA